MKKSPLFIKSDKLVHNIYDFTVNVPKSEQYGFTSQIRRAALSVPTNIVEGYSRNNRKEFKRFLWISYGSLKEVKYLLIFANRRKYINKKDIKKLLKEVDELARIIWTSIKTIE